MRTRVYLVLGTALVLCYFGAKLALALRALGA